MSCWMKRKAILTQGKTSYYSARVLLWIPTVLCNPIFVNRRWQAGPPFSSLTVAGWGLPSLPSCAYSCRSSWSLAHTLFEGAQPRVWGGTSLCIWGTDEKTLPVLPLVTVFLLSTRLTVFWTPSPRPFLPEDVIKDGQEKRAKSELTRRSGCLVPSRKSRDKCWILAIYRQHKTSLFLSCCGCHGRQTIYPASLSSSFLTTSHRPPAWAGPGPHSLLIGI